MLNYSQKSWLGQFTTDAWNLLLGLAGLAYAIGIVFYMFYQLAK
jgi:hypothetical protein